MTHFNIAANSISCNTAVKPEVLRFSNYNLKQVVMPVKAELFAQMLSDVGYPEEKVKFLYHGFTRGFDIQYQGPTDRQSQTENIPFTVGDKVDLWNKLMKEVKLNWVVGPFEKVPFSNFIQSPIGLVPKAGGDQTRLIFHLSYDFKNDRHKSVNFHTPKELCTVKYKDLDFAVQTYLQLCEELMKDSSEVELLAND